MLTAQEGTKRFALNLACLFFEATKIKKEGQNCEKLSCVQVLVKMVPVAQKLRMTA
jgi:hypothetical protein